MLCRVSRCSRGDCVVVSVLTVVDALEGRVCAACLVIKCGKIKKSDISNCPDGLALEVWTTMCVILIL